MMGTGGGARIIERLICDFAVDLAAVAPDTDFREEMAMLAPMQWDGLIETDGKITLIVTDAGRAVVRLIAAAFDTYRRPRTAQFGKTI